MKFTTNKYLTIADTETCEYINLRSELKAKKMSDFMDEICIYSLNGTNTSKEILKINSVEIVKDHGEIKAWVDLIAMDYERFYKISMDAYSCENSFVQTYSKN